MRNPSCPVCILALLLAAFPAWSQKSRAAEIPGVEDGPKYEQSVAVVVLSEGEGAEAFAESLAAALLRELSTAGFTASARPAPADTGGTEADIARSVSEAGGDRWTAFARCTLSGSQGRLLWHAAVYDALDGALIAADSQGAYGGLSALAFLEDSAKKVAKEAAALKDRRVPGRHIDYRIRFVSGDEGARVSFGSGEGAREAGVVENGELLAPFVAFRAGDPLVVTVSKEGFWPKTDVFSLTEEDREIRLPELMFQASESFSLGLATGRLLGATAEYRRFLAPDSLYLKASNSLWIQYTFRPGSIPVLHDEVRLGAGVYLFRPRDARFRVALGTGASGIATLILGGHLEKRFFFDAILDPVWFSWEWHFPSWALVLDQRVSYSLGLDSGLLERGWIEQGHMPFILTLGVLKKW